MTSALGRGPGVTGKVLAGGLADLAGGGHVVEVAASLGWVDWFNNTRLHSSLSYRTPAQVEAE